GGGPEGVVAAVVGQPEAADKLISGRAEEMSEFGTSVSMSGSWAAVGQPEIFAPTNPAGRVEILERDGLGDWTSVQSIDPPGFVTGANAFGTDVALDGNVLAVLYANSTGNELTIYERADSLSPFALAETFAMSGLAPAGSIFTAVAVNGTRVAAVARGAGAADATTLRVFNQTSLTNWAVADNITPPGTSSTDLDVAIDGDLIAVGMPSEANGGNPNSSSDFVGAVHVFVDTAGTWSTSPVSTLRAPDFAITGDLRFGTSVTLHDDTLLVGAEGAVSAGSLTGAAWFYEHTVTPGVFDAPQGVVGSNAGSFQFFGTSVGVWGDRAIIGERDQSNPGAAHVFTRRNGVWQQAALLQAPDAAFEDEFFGRAVDIDQESILVGSPGDTNSNGITAGAVYWFESVTPTGNDAPILTIDVTGPGATVTAGASGIAVNSLPARNIDGYGGDDSNVVSTSLEAVDGATDAGVAEVLTETTVADLGLGGAGTDGIGRELVESILLSDVVIDGGWEPVLVGSVFEGLPLQNVTLGQVLDAGLIDGRPLEVLDLSATPIGSIPIGSIALAETVLDDITLPGGQSWCDLLGAVSPGYDCTTTPAADPANDSLIDLAIQGTPIGSIPIGSIPIGSIPIGSIPIGSIPIGSIDIEASPIGSIPIGSIDIGSTPIGSIPIGSIPIGSIPIGSIDVGSTPIGSIPIGSITIGEIALGDLSVVPGVAASPIGSIPIGSIDLQAAPIGSIPIGSIPIGSIPIGSIPIGSIPIGSIPIGSIPIGSIDLAASPIGSIPIGSIPIGSIPIGSIPIGSIPIGSIPIGSIPIGSIPIGSIPIGSIDLTASPIGSIPIGSIPVAQRATIVDCSLIDCTQRFDLADAFDAGALLPGATLAGLEDVPTGVRLSDLVGVDGLDRAAIEAQLASLIASPAFDTLSDFSTTDDLTLAELPANAPEVSQTDVGDLVDALDTVSLADLLAAVGADEAALRAELTRAGIIELNDLTDTSGMVLGDLPSTRSEFIAQPVTDLLAAMTDVRLGDLLALHPTLDASDVNWGASTLADITGWQDVTLAELTEYDDTSLAELVDALNAATSDELTFGEVLLSLVGVERHDWTDVKLGSIELENATGAQTFTSGFEVVGGIGIDRTVTIRSTIPDDAVYAAGTTVIRAGDSGTLPGGAGEPTIDGNQLVWTLSGVRSAVRYEIDIDVVSALSLGTNTVGTTGAIVGLGIGATGFTSVGVQQAFEPNDVPTDVGVVDVVSGSIYASHIATSTDVDLFAIDLPAGARLSVALSDLPADYDLVVYGPPVQALAPPLRQIEPSEPPLLTLDPTVNDDGGALLQDVPLLDRPVVGVSSSRSTDNESVVINSVRSAGTYYVQVSGYSGASSNQPYALYIASDAPAAPLVCAAQDYQSVADRGTLPGVGELIGVNTIVLVNRERLVGKYGSNASVALDAVDDLVTYTNVTNPALGTNAVVVEVDGDDDVRAAFDAYDAASCEPGTANDVVAEINELVDTIDAADPATALTQILIVGDDDVIPMARIADDTTIANERTYASTFIDSTANSLFGALSTGHFLSDDPYGDADPIRSGDRILYVTDVGLGRLVETPAEIAGQVAAFIGFEGLLDPSTALVTGYDFLTDGSNAIVDELDALPDTTSVTEIINESWTASDVIDGLFPAIGESPNIASINAHFDHYRALPADQNASGSESDLFTTADVNLAARQNRLVGRSLFSMGCHGGLSVPDELFPGTTDGIALDWAQAFARQDAIWVGNTGFGYGETEGVELSERLMALYASRLDGSVNAGEALLYAKQEYLGTQQATYGAFDEKVLQQTVFYGIPFYNVDVVDEPAAAPIPPRPATEAVPGTDLRVNTIEVAPDFTSETNVGGVVYSADLPAGTPGAAGEQSTPFAPILPTASFDVSDVDPTGVAPETVAQGAVITGLVTTDVTGVDPDLARPIVDDSNVETEPRVGNISTDPELFVSSFATPEGPRQSLTATLSTFRSTSPDGSGTQRLFDELEVETYFRTPGDDADQARPTFREVRSSTTDIGGQQVLVIDAIVADDLPDNVLRVFALVAVDPGASTEWTLVEMIRLGGDRWSGSLPIGSGDVEYLVQAIDSNGNAALSTNKARGFDAVSEQSPVGGDIEVVYSVTPGVVFAGPVTLTATAGGAVVDSQLNGGLVVAGSTSTVVTLDPAVIGEGAHTVVFSTESGAQRTEVLVFDDTAPVANIISPVEAATVEGGAGGRLRYSCADAATGVASCVGLLDGQPVASGSLVPAGLGSKTLVVTATDVAGMTSSAQSTFSVADTIDPVVSVPGDITVPTDPGASSAVVSFTATATDNDPSPSLSCTPASGAAFVFGTTQVTCTATDAAGNIGSGSFDVIVTDDTVPVLTMPDDIVSSTDPGQATAVVTFADPLVFDNLATTVSCDAVSGSVFPLGMTEITCSATDAAGNAASDSFFVTVIDGEAPVIASVDDVSAVASTSAGVAVSYDSPVVSDNVDVSSTATCVPVSGSTFNVGDTTVTCDVSDSAGNAAVSVEFTVSVTLAADTSDPVVSVPA
ncbi:MAG: HYR domain-containing protein, partial [Ilumatobacter sp.]